MKSISRLWLALALALSAFPALAADDTTVAVLPIYKILEPYLVTLVSVIASALVGWIAIVIKNKFGLDIDAHMRETIQTAATNAAGALVARMEGPIGTISIDVRSKLVKDGVDMVIAKVPDAINHFKLSPEELAAIVQAKLGILQSATPAK